MIKKPKDWLTLKEVKNYVKGFGRHWTKANIYLLMSEGKLLGFKVGSARLFEKSEIDKCIQSLTKFPPKAKKSKKERR